MRHSEQDKRRSHERIVDAAARRIRAAGTDGPGVAEIMADAGMTHGGFYKHFASRDELIAEAAERACADGSTRLAEAVDHAADPLAALITAYLATEHRDDPSAGCAVAALGGDAARPGNAARGAYTAQIRRYIERLQGLLDAEGEPGEAGDIGEAGHVGGAGDPGDVGDPDGAGDRRVRAIAVMSTLVGALIISRAVDDPDLADEVLRASRNVLLASADSNPHSSDRAPA